MEIKYYFIHDIFKVIIINNTECKFIKKFNSDYSYFEVDFLEEADLVINIGKFTPQNEDCYVVDHKYYVKENYLYCKDSAGKLKWETEINGFENGQIKININPLKKQTILNLGLPVHTFLLEGMLMYGLLNHGYCIIHAACVSKNKKALLFAGRGGSFKTSLVMDLVRELNYKYMADDKIILNKSYAYSFPVSINRFIFMLSNMENEKYANRIEKAKMIKHLFINDRENERKDSYEFIEDISLIDKLIFVSRTNSSKVQIKQISDPQQLIKKLVENNRLELCLNGSHLPSLTKMRTNPFYRYMTEYSYVYPQSKIAQYWDNLNERLSQILNCDLVYEIQMPYKYDKESFEEFKKYLNL